jgi:hypothetical protein
MLRPLYGDAKNERTTLPPLPVVMRDGGEEFEVESVVSYRRHRGKPQYLIKWLGWPLSESTWESEKDLTHCDSALKHFHEEAAFSRGSGTQNLGEKGSCVRVRAGSPEPSCKDPVV